MRQLERDVREEVGRRGVRRRDAVVGLLHRGVEVESQSRASVKREAALDGKAWPMTR